jgi:tRNA modification GTPase
MTLAGVPVTLADTAGLREAGDEIEAEGIRRARRQAEEADVLLAVFAADQAPDAETLAALKPGAVVVVNKSDLTPVPRLQLGSLSVSARSGEGLPALRSQLEREATVLAGLTAEAAFTRPRHRAALQEALVWLDRLPEAPAPELRAETLRAALRALGRLTGQVGVEAILDLVFAEFCIGK